MTGAFKVFLVSVIITEVSLHQNKANDTLQLVHVILRHGERTIDEQTIYPNDPYKNLTYYPYGIGQLTLEGKKTEFKIGTGLRKRYDQFLGKIYTPDLIYALSTDYDRTKMSLELALAGLFPPTENYKIRNDINWQPIPYNYLPRGQDPLLLTASCSEYKQAYQEYINSKRMQKEFARHRRLFRFLSQKSGWNITTYEDIFYLYFGLKSEVEWGLELPEWTKNVYPQPMEDLLIREYTVATGTTNLRKYGVGNFLKKVVNDTYSKIYNNLVPSGRKLFIYSAHEWNIASVLNTLNVFDKQIPPYGSHIIIEVHKINEEYGFKIFYENYKGPNPLLLKLPGCKEFCPIEQFVSLVEEYFPTNNICTKEALIGT